MKPEKWVLYSLLLFVFFGFCTSIDTITPNQPIKDGDLLVSNGETFALGFFSPGNSILRYVGVWYNKISEQTVVWVANRENPINGTSGVLSFNKDGNLVIYDFHNQDVPLWQTNVLTATNSSYSAQLLDSGNLVLFQAGGAGTSSRVFPWQSFDCPTHTMLPGMKLGLDRRTGLDRFLTSWKSRDDPGTGEHSYWVDPSEVPELVLFNGSVRVWRALPWVEKIGNVKPGLSPAMIIHGSHVDNQDEVTDVYSLMDASIESRVFLDEFGYLQVASWVAEHRSWVNFYTFPMDRCEHYGRCGAYGTCDSSHGREFECTCLPGYEPKSAKEWNLRDASGGCVKKRAGLAMCGNGEGFLKVANTKAPDTSSKARLGMNMSMKECEQKCLRNCSCTAYTSGGGGGCITWYGNLMDITIIDGGVDLNVRVDAVELAQHLKKSRSLHRKKVVIVVLVFVTSVLIISLVCCLVMKKTRRGLDIKASDNESLELPIFDMVTIARATNKFSDTNKIGQGGFGSVYKGQLSTGQEIAVKRLSANSKQGLNEFKNEVILIAKLQHRNLVRLLGSCIQGEERMLVYEYMPNGSLDSFIFGLEITRSKFLTWRRRLDIILGIARGVLYLHQDSRLRVIHRDLKASNVLLDSDMNPKISDFGMARAFESDQSYAKTRRVVGTYGYMSPEYTIDGIFSMKSDVFSFGVIILEIISGKRNRLFHHPDHDLNLLGHAWKLWLEGKASQLLDPLMEGSFPMLEVLRCIQVGLLCVQKCPEDRPTMSSVLLMLVTESSILSQPMQPSFYIERNSNEAHHPQAKYASSINKVTLSDLEAR